MVGVPGDVAVVPRALEDGASAPPVVVLADGPVLEVGAVVPPLVFFGAGPFPVVVCVCGSCGAALGRGEALRGGGGCAVPLMLPAVRGVELPLALAVVSTVPDGVGGGTVVVCVPGDGPVVPRALDDIACAPPAVVPADGIVLEVGAVVPPLVFLGAGPVPVGVCVLGCSFLEKSL